jgi:parallel beta-helix repeat protein
MNLKAVALLAAALCLAGATVIHVPGDSATIQKGLNGAASGDTVLVAPGSYKEQIVWPNRDGIALLSEAGAEATEVSGNNAGRVITMNARDYTGSTVVSGFTIASGLVTVYPGDGAGVWCRGAPVFCNDQIVHNLNLTMGYGGGVYGVGAPVFHHDLIAWDTVWNPGGGGWRYGGGIYCQGPGVFYQNVFLENAAYDTNPGGFWYGGGLCLEGSGLVFNNLFVRNSCGATSGGFAYGGALYLDSGLVANNTFVANRCSCAVPYGGAIYASNSQSVTIKNNIIVNNTARGIVPYGGGIACYPDSLDTLVCDYNDVWQNSPADYYSCRPGTGAVSLDPLLVAGPNGDYYLSQVAAGQDSTSPGVDAGDTLLGEVPLNLDSLVHAWTTRTDSLPDSGLIDMGYHYLSYPLVALRQQPGSPPSRVLLEAEPNPFRNSVRLEVPGGAGAEPVEIRDVMGRRVCQLPVRAGWCRWDCRSPAGVYFARSGSLRLKLVRE